MKHLSIVGLIAAASLTGFALTSAASAAVLNNSNGGDGYVITSATGFDLFGSDNGAENNYTTYTNTATMSQLLSFSYTYTTNDVDGSAYDPAGYVLNGVYTQVTADDQPFGSSQSGVVTFNLSAGDNYGFYVFTTDGVLGRADIAVMPGLGMSSVPLPASAPLFGAGLIALGAAGYAAKRKKAAAAA